MLGDNKEPRSVLSSEMKIVLFMRKMNTPAHVSKKHGECQRTYINTNKARSMTEIPEQLSIRATIKTKLVLHSKPNSAASIYHTPSPNAKALHLFITAMHFFEPASAYQTVDFPAESPSGLKVCAHLTPPCLSFMSMCH